MKIVEDIKKKDNINEIFYNGKKMDPENRLFISDNYVIKIYYPKKFEYFNNELEVYNNLKDKEYIPELHSYGENDGYKYIIMSKINGISLFDIWSKSSYTERKSYLKDIAIILKDINNIKSSKIDFKNLMSFNFKELLGKLPYTSDTINHINYIFNENIDYITNEEQASLIHIDTHFYNFMIDENKKLIAYDFEHTMMAPKDYQLVRLYRMNYYPESFVYPKNSLNQNEIKKYNSVLFNIIDNYPEIINNNTDKRLKVYLLNYLLTEAIRCNIKENDVLNIIEENKKIRIRG